MLTGTQNLLLQLTDNHARDHPKLEFQDISTDLIVDLGRVRKEISVKIPVEGKSRNETKSIHKRAGKEAKLCFSGQVLMENRHGLVINTQTTLVTGTAEREAALVMVKDKTNWDYSRWR